MSQKSTILNILTDYEFHCSSEFYANYIADPRTRLCELKKAGYVLENRKCEKHDYHKGFSKQWKLLGYVGEISRPRLTNDELALGV